MASRSIALVALTLCGCNWVSLAANAITYETLAPGEAGNIVARDSVAYVTLADSGFAVVDVVSGKRIATVSPSGGMGSVDDVAIDGDLLFALDARPPGALGVWSLRDPYRPARVSQPRLVPVGPFSGISARDGLCIVSGGTSALTTWRYDPAGSVESAGILDLGRGQPDVIVAANGVAYVSTHYWGPYFGLDVVRRSAGELVRAGRVELEGAGFTTGGAKPANFPIESALLDSVTLLVAHRRGLAVIGVASPTEPKVIEIIDVGGPATSVDALGRVAVVAVGGREPALAFVDFSGGGAHVRRVTLPRGTNPVGVALSRRNALVAARGQGILVVQR
jgi:hypothetical protein